MTLSASIKPLGLSVFLPLLFLTVKEKENRLKRLLPFVAYIVVALTVPLLWIKYAQYLQEQSGLHQFYLGSGMKETLDYLFSYTFVQNLILRWPFELWLGWAVLPAFLIGIFIKEKRSEKTFLWLWVAACFIVFALTSLKSSTHDYYSLIIVPPLAIFSGLGLGKLLEYQNWKKVLGILIMILMPITLGLRLHHRYGEIDDYYQIRNSVDEIIPKDCLVIVRDNTPSIRLYQLNRRGWPLRNSNDEKPVFDAVTEGAKFLLLEQPITSYSDTLQSLFTKSDTMLGPLYCYQVKTDKDKSERQD